MIRIILSLFVSGILFGSGPCMASCGPILFSYIAGTKKNILESIKAYATFSLARVCVYACLSLVIFFFGRFGLENLLGNWARYVLIIGGSFIILVGLLMITGKRSGFNKFCSGLQKNILERDTKSIIIFGLVLGIIPCAPMIAVLSYIGLVSDSWIDSLLYGSFFGLGTILSPLLLFAVIAGSMPKFLSNKKPIFSQLINILASLFIIFFGMQLIYKGI